MFKPTCVVLLVTATVACGGNGPADRLTTPSPFGEATVPEATGGPLAATLAVSTFSVTRRAEQLSGWVVYDVKLMLAETGGRSGATLRSIELSAAGMGTDSGCAGSRRVRIGPGETWDMDSLGYCAPEVSIHRSVGNDISSVSLTVTFADDDGRVGHLSSSVLTN